MASVLAIVSKGIFEKDAIVGGRLATIGTVVPFTRYVSKNKGLTPLASGGALFLVTVRPPDEALWLVAVLESPVHDGENWNSPANMVPVVDISGLKDRIKFANGTGISAKKGALGMSLQTPRVLSDEDIALLRAASGVGPAAPAQAAVKGHLNAHEPDSIAPCLCRKCIGQAPERVTVSGLVLVREQAAASGRTLWYWRPENLAAERDTIRKSVEVGLARRAQQTRGRVRTVEDLEAIFAGKEGDDE